MGKKFKHWNALSRETPLDHDTLSSILLRNRRFEPILKLEYGDYGLDAAMSAVARAIRDNRRIALYADYDVDGTMSCVSWAWFLRAIGFNNFIHYIPCRFKEGYGVNLNAVKHLIDNEKAQLIITMDTGITANEEAAYCRERGVDFICTDHHKIQPDRMPDCIVLNPKLHPSELYQELCGCGITFVLLRRLAEQFPVPSEVWTDLLALAGMATICDVVPLNSVNHRLARQGVAAMLRSRRPVILRLLAAASLGKEMDEKDVGFRLGPRINAVGRLGHADQVVRAFLEESPDDLIQHMGDCNEERKQLQAEIVKDATQKAMARAEDSILFLGGDWHPGVVGIAASKVAEKFWKPTWLFERKDGKGKGSARSIPGFDVTEAMQSCAGLFTKFGGHRAAGGFTFALEREAEIAAALNAFAKQKREADATLWESRIDYDCELAAQLLTLPLMDRLDELKPFGNSFEEPRFLVQAKLRGVDYYLDKTTGERKHTAVVIEGANKRTQKILFFNEVFDDLGQAAEARFVVSASRNSFRGQVSVSLQGHDYEI